MHLTRTDQFEIVLISSQKSVECLNDLPDGQGGQRLLVAEQEHVGEFVRGGRLLHFVVTAQRFDDHRLT